MSSRNFQAGDVYGISFTVKASSGALINADSLPVAAMYRNGVIDNTVTMSVTNSATGIYNATCTIPSGYAVADRVSVLVTATIGGVSTGEFVDHVRLVGYPNNALPNAQAGVAGGLVIDPWAVTLPGTYSANTAAWFLSNVFDGCKLDGTHTVRQYLILAMSALFGKTSGFETTSPHIYDCRDNSTLVISSTTADQYGNRGTPTINWPA